MDRARFGRLAGEGSATPPGPGPRCSRDTAVSGSTTTIGDSA